MPGRGACVEHPAIACLKAGEMPLQLYDILGARCFIVAGAGQNLVGGGAVNNHWRSRFSGLARGRDNMYLNKYIFWRDHASCFWVSVHHRV